MSMKLSLIILNYFKFFYTLLKTNGQLFSKLLVLDGKFGFTQYVKF